MWKTIHVNLLRLKLVDRVLSSLGLIVPLVFISITPMFGPECVRRTRSLFWRSSILSRAWSPRFPGCGGSGSCQVRNSFESKRACRPALCPEHNHCLMTHRTETKLSWANLPPHLTGYFWLEQSDLEHRFSFAHRQVGVPNRGPNPRFHCSRDGSTPVMLCCCGETCQPDCALLYCRQAQTHLSALKIRSMTKY